VSVRVAVIGCGAWGENLVRAFASNLRADVVAVADPSPARLERAAAIAPRARRVPSLDDALALGVDAVVIATPPPTHAELVLRALDAGADVLVEKPLALGPADAERCAARAAALGRIGMVGHLLRYHPAVVRALELAAEGHLGEIVGFGATRLSTHAAHAGGASIDSSAAALWALGPHDLSVLGALDPSPVREVVAEPSGERLRLSVRLESGLGARLELGRGSPAKERRLRITGTARIALLDDVHTPDRVLLARAGRGTTRAGGPLSVEQDIRVPWREPLAVEVEHFLRCVEERARPLTPLEEGAAVVRVLARAAAAHARPAALAASAL